jgi:hypothetical protein
MKLALLTFALAAGATLCAPAFAQSTAPANTNPAAATASPPADAPSAVTQAGQWTPPYGQPVAGKTRAEVYQELIQAEKDGQLQYLNSTLYSHG